MKFIPIIPSYNPDDKLLNIIDKLTDIGFEDIIVVDDGSRKKDIFDKIRKNKKCIILTHKENCGKGVALKTAFKYYKDNLFTKYKGIVTLDGDGQHHVSDMVSVGNEMLISHDVVFGVRKFNESNVPIRNKLGNQITSKVFYLLYKSYIKDTQTGLRAFPNKYIDKLLNISGDRFEYEMNVLLELVMDKIVIEQLPIKTIYLEKNNKYSHFKPIIDSFKIYMNMFKKRYY